MSLTYEDLQQIEAIFDRKLEPIFGELEALRNDIKEIYDMIAALQKHPIPTDPAFQKLSVKEQLLQLNAALLVVAKKEGVILPR